LFYISDNIRMYHGMNFAVKCPLDNINDFCHSATKYI